MSQLERQLRLAEAPGQHIEHFKTGQLCAQLSSQVDPVGLLYYVVYMYCAASTRCSATAGPLGATLAALGDL